MPRATRDGVSIYYEFDERPMDERRTATPVVFLQDLGYGRWMWRWQREAVAREFGAPVIAPDLRGTGRSDAGLPPLVPRLPGRLRTPLLQNVAGYSVSGLAADLEAVLDDAGVHSVHLVGSGLGGMIAQQYAIDHDRAASLTLCGTTHGGADAGPITDEIPSRLLAASAGGSERERLREQLRPVFTPAFTNRNPHLIDQVLEWRLEQDASRPALEAQLGAFLGFDSSAELDKIDVPTLIVHGTNDEVVPWLNARLLEEAIPDTRLEVIEGGPHLLGVERADEVTDALLSFVAAQEDEDAFAATRTPRVTDSR
ncbi:alpha/beta fold hydrolase [Natrialba sp. SSL1]|uniref:alpha/beta fold hydrolase n=1 Tax=Natrialba sp. SSL1 TaxID=1869245 RepID=UPI0008F85632|nr:alpha/beta hydrolase [Natrialba sp. SSL1]OIB55616.1 3-oxoadipate enol-lactone hydrolase [Natrialba sp. SSL1]